LHRHKIPSRCSNTSKSRERCSRSGQHPPTEMSALRSRPPPRTPTPLRSAESLRPRCRTRAGRTSSGSSEAASRSHPPRASTSSHSRDMRGSRPSFPSSSRPPPLALPRSCPVLRHTRSSSRPNQARSRPPCSRAPLRHSGACACPPPRSGASRPPTRPRTSESGPPSPRTCRGGSR